jgi:hypothetical protein
LQIDKQCNYMLQIKFAFINISNCMPPNFVWIFTDYGKCF